ncbi:MAG: DeoR family transcriptional regulator, partial [Pseudomonadota bacterium]|nr:DeoR family transcriptional regulator [Pseudomonadota bacterium]
MDRTERFYTIDRLLRGRRKVSLHQLMEELEVSRATVRRDLEYMRDRMAA